MQNGYKHALTAIALLMIGLMAFSLSADQAISIISVQNNYLLNGETASVSKTPITYKGEKYLIVAALGSDSKINAYIPVKDSNGEIASQDLQMRELIKTAILYSGMTQLNQSVSSSDWPFSYSTKSYFFDLGSDYGSLMSSLITVQTELGKITDDTKATTLATSAGKTKTMADELAKECIKIASQIEQGRAFEQNFFNNPDTNKTTQYENNYTQYFTEVQNIKDKFIALDLKLTEISQGIGALESTQTTIDQKRSLQNLLDEPQNAGRLPTFFNTTDALRTEIEGIFNTEKNSATFAATLTSRKLRNEAWQLIYGHNEAMLKLDASFETLQSAAQAVLSETNVDQWNNQDAVTALKTNWANTQSRFNNAEYDKAKDYATKAAGNIKLIIADGAIQTPTDNNDLIIKAVIGLVILTIALFIIQNILSRKKKEEGEKLEEQYT